MIKSLVATCMTPSAENQIYVLEGLSVNSCFGNAYSQAQIAWRKGEWIVCMDTFLFVRGGFGSGDLDADLIPGGLVWTLSPRPPRNADTCNRLVHPLDVRCRCVAFQLQKGMVSLSAWPSVLLKTAHLCLASNHSQRKAVWVAFSNLCLPQSLGPPT